MILPKTGDNYLKMYSARFSSRTSSATMQYVCPKYMPYVFYQVLWKFYLYGNSMNFGKKNSGVRFWSIMAKTWTKKHGAKKLAMSTKQMQDIFSPMFFLCPQGEHLQCFGEKKYVQFCVQTFDENIFPVFTTDIRCFYQSLYCHNLWQLVKTSNVYCEKRE